MMKLYALPGSYSPNRNFISLALCPETAYNSGWRKTYSVLFFISCNTGQQSTNKVSFILCNALTELFYYCFQFDLKSKPVSIHNFILFPDNDRNLRLTHQPLSTKQYTPKMTTLLFSVVFSLTCIVSHERNWQVARLRCVWHESSCHVLHVYDKSHCTINRPQLPRVWKFS